MKPLKFWLVIILLILSITYIYFFPKVKYVGTDFISGLKIPSTFAEWQGRDVSDALNINLAEFQFSFISEILANEYINTRGGKLLFIILDAGNFHHPKVCFTGAGYKIKELSDTEFHLSDRTFKAHTLFTTKGKDSFLSFYWIVIDKNIAHEWIEQKIKQFYFSLFNRKKIGLMIRIDIPAKEDNIQDAMTLAKQFISDISQSLIQEQKDFIFGENVFSHPIQRPPQRAL